MEIYIPDIYQKNIYDINYKKLKKNGIKCILFDLDNTLIRPVSFARNIKVPSPNTLELFKKLKKLGFKLIVFSNGLKGKTQRYGEIVGLETRSRMKKPSTEGFEEIMKTFNLKQTEVIMIGDQILTDIKGGNEAGITTALIRPLSKSEFIFTRINRIKEKRVMKKLARKDLFRIGKYYD